MKPMTRRCCLGMLLATPLLAACRHETPPTAKAALEPDRNTACSLDGMSLADYPGPKGQLQYAQGAPDFFCDTVELFAVYLKPEQQRLVAAVYVQDMSKTDWEHPQGHWIDARSAFYVVGSRLKGSMGATFASYGSEAAARAVAARQGGKVYRFSDITPAMAELDGGVLKDKSM
jgi:copper chaperone NosL